MNKYFKQILMSKHSVITMSTCSICFREIPVFYPLYCQLSITMWNTQVEEKRLPAPYWLGFCCETNQGVFTIMPLSDSGSGNIVAAAGKYEFSCP